MFSDGKQKIIYGKSHKNQSINNKPTRTNTSFVQLIQNKNKTKGLVGSKKNSNPWKLIKIDSSKKGKKGKKPKKKGKTRKS